MTNCPPVTQPAPALHARQITLRAGARTLLHAVDFSLRPGELLGIIGPNGAGKTSLLRALLGLAVPHSGQVWLQGRPLAHWPLPERARQMAYLAQGHQAHWPLPAREVAALGRLPHGDANQPTGQAAIDAALRATGAQAFAARNVQSLSGGERARVLLARALAVRAPVLLADEPLAALDPAQQLHCMALLQSQARAGQAVAVVLHDLTLASRFCTRLLLLHEGRVACDAAPSEALSDAHLARTFGIEALLLHSEGALCIIPWRAAPSSSCPPTPHDR